MIIRFQPYIKNLKWILYNNKLERKKKEGCDPTSSENQTVDPTNL
jgi:hypothetical protein